MESVLSIDKPLNRPGFLASTLITFWIAGTLGYFSLKLLSQHHGFFPLAIFICIIVGAFTAGILLLLTLRRLRDLRWKGLLSLLIWVPGVNLLWYALLLLANPRNTAS
jgi:uncharacterized membrane protein YhaH (DUF805 family)